MKEYFGRDLAALPSRDGGKELEGVGTRYGARRTTIFFSSW